MNHSFRFAIRLGVAATLCGVLANTTTLADSQETKRQHVLVCLPNAQTNALPSVAFVDAVNQAASMKRAFGTACTLTIIAPEPVLAMYARIILRSYGIGKQDVEIATSLNSVAVRDSEELTRIGSCGSTRFGRTGTLKKRSQFRRHFRPQ